MKKLIFVLGLTVAVSGCSPTSATEIPTGSAVTLEKQDGVTIAGRLLEVKPEHVVIQARDGVETTVPRAEIAHLRTAPPSGNPSAPVEPAPASTPVAPERAPATAAAPAAETKAAEATEDPKPLFREITIPAGTVLPLTLGTAVGSDTSKVEDPVRATLRNGVTVAGVEALPAGTVVTGHVTHALRAARVKGRAQVAFRFTRLDQPGEGGRTQIRTASVSRLAPATKKRDAVTIGGGAVGGAIIGGIVGGGDGAAKGAAIGGAAGTGAVLATRGKEVRVPSGTQLSVRLSAPVTVRVPSR